MLCLTQKPIPEEFQSNTEHEAIEDLIKKVLIDACDQPGSQQHTDRCKGDQPEGNGQIGHVELAKHGSYGIAFVILLASVGIPLAKFLAIAFLALSVQRRDAIAPERRQQLYEVVEYIGRWSMIDVFVVAILASLVQLNIVVTITPGPAALTFALSVIFTMLSAQAFDSRMIWDLQSPPERSPA